LKIAAIQSKVIEGLYSTKTGDHALKLLETAAKEDIDIACLPEGSIEEERISAKAKDLGIFVLGSVVKSTQKNYHFDETIIVNPEGKIVGRHRRVLLYWTFEPEIILPGKKFDVFRTKVGNIGILKCWEISHPEAATVLALKDADIIFNPANWMSNLVDLWHRMLFMRCYETHVPIIGVNPAKWKNTGIIYKDKVLSVFYGGKSAIVLPENLNSLEDASLEAWNRKMLFTDERMFKVKAGDKEEIIYSEIDLNSFKKYRLGRLNNRFPAIRYLKEINLPQGGRFKCA